MWWWNDFWPMPWVFGGGSAGLRMMIALPRSAPPIVSTPARGGPGELVDVRPRARAGRAARRRGDDLGVATPASTRETAATIGIVAWPPQVIMLTFGALEVLVAG